MTPAQTAQTAKPVEASSLYVIPAEETQAQRIGEIVQQPVEVNVQVDTAELAETISEAIAEISEIQQPAPAYSEPQKSAYVGGYVPRVLTVGYSYYNPALGGVNCIDFQNGECVSTLGNGEAWQDWIDKGSVAIPPSWIVEGWAHYGDRLVILSPAEVAGEYLIQDLCNGCEAANWADGMYRLDILATSQALAWATPMTVWLPDSLGSIPAP